MVQVLRHDELVGSVVADHGLLAAEAEKERTKEAEREVMIQEMLAKSAEELVCMNGSYSFLDTASNGQRFVYYEFLTVSMPKDERLDAKRGEAERIATVKTEEAKAKAQAKLAACEADFAKKEAEKEAEAEARVAVIAEWVEAHGTENQKARLADGLLPESEIVDAIRDEVFAPMDSMYAGHYGEVGGRYEKMKSSDVCTCESYYDEGTCHVVFSVEDATELTAEQYEVIVAARKAMPKATIKARVHIGSGDECESVEKRYSLHVKVDYHGIPLSREYAL